MPPLARKILVTAAIDGLILSPIQNSRNVRPPPLHSSVRIDYKSKLIFSYNPTEESQAAEALSTLASSIEAHGIVAGLLNVSPASAFLIAITDREQVATIRGRYPIYVVTGVALIPLSSRKDSEAAISKARAWKSGAGEAESDEAPDTDIEEDDDTAIVDDELQDQVNPDSKSVNHRRQSSIGEDVIGRKGAYGRFAENWFSKRGWTVDRRRAEGLSSDEGIREEDPKAATEDTASASDEEIKDTKRPENQQVEEDAEAMKEDVAHSLTPKLLRTTRILLASSRSFFFSYDWDITRAWGRDEKNQSSSLPLHESVDSLFFWNRALQKPFIESGNDTFVLPIMQGFVGQFQFSATVPSGPELWPPTEPGEQKATEVSHEDGKQNLLLTLISRRSIKRAGLRYLRRGVDDCGNVANCVETEQILSDPDWNRVFSHVQLRGSIPLYFQQSPYALRPKPVLLRSEAANAEAFQLHFRNIKQRYGSIHAVSLVEKRGNEAIIGGKFQSSFENLPNTNKGVGFNWFDFHRECRGMRFENVKLLFDEIGETLDKFEYTEEIQEDGKSKRVKSQSGVLRTNCMDCLDRTNVVQSFCARNSLDKQLISLGVTSMSAEEEMKVSAGFNILWADNGDAISKQYASTAALKGDFTRTRKRNYRGALTDFGLTLSRFFTNAVSDFFTQAAIDFLLGNVTSKDFEEFEEEMITADPAVSVKKVRENAVEISAKIVVEDENEVVLGGWTFLTPSGEGSGRKPPLREVVIIVTDRALYRCRFEFGIEKVREFERVELEDIIGVQWGTYIISTLTPSSTDERRNIGFLLKYRPPRAGELVRINTRSLRSTFAKPMGEYHDHDDSDTHSEAAAPFTAAAATISSSSATRIMAFKAPASGESGEVDLVKSVCQEIANACAKNRPAAAMEAFVENKDVIGLAEAKKSTGLLEQWGYNLRKLVWA
ncbi:phosphoinositide phosphatase SAC1 [Tuber indicum]|nr:phosphoinositide phosphatase SAC1 [Tuber indicum]